MTDSTEGIDGTTSAEEVEQLRHEVEALEHKLDRGRVWATRRRRVRRGAVGVLVVLFCVGLVASTIAVWARQTALKTDRFVSAVSDLPQQPAVRAALATFLVDELLSVTDAQQRIEDALAEVSENITFIAGPITSAVGNYLTGTVEDVLASDAFDDLWVEAVRIAHEAVVTVLNDDADALNVENGEVELNLVPVVNEILKRAESVAPGFLGTDITLPEVTDQSAEELRTALSDSLGVELPENFAQITIFDESRLSEAQDAVDLANRFVVVLVIVTLLAGVLAMVLSVDRRRTLLQLALGTAIAMFLVFRVVRVLAQDIVEKIPGSQNQQAATEAASVVFEGLRTLGLWIGWLAFALAIVLYLVGPGRWPRALRRWVVEGTRRAGEGARTYRQPALDWSRAHLDELRIGGAAAAFLLLIVLDTSWTTFWVLLLLLGAYELGLTILGRRAPAPT